MSLYRRELITYDEALRQATNPDDFALQVSGISSTSDARWDDFDKPADSRAGASAEATSEGSPFGQPRPPVDRPTTKPSPPLPRLVKRF
jgi:twitching motility protein PilT